MSDSVRPHRQQPTRFSGPWDSPGKNTGVGCHFLLQCMKVKSESEVTQQCLILSDPMDCRLSGSSVHGIFQARVLEWGAIAFSENLCYDPTDVWVCFLILHSIGVSCSITKLCCCCSATESCLSLCDPMDSSMPSLLVPHYLLKFVLITKIL